MKVIFAIEVVMDVDEEEVTKDSIFKMQGNMNIEDAVSVKATAFSIKTGTVDMTDEFIRISNEM